MAHKLFQRSAPRLLLYISIIFLRARLQTFLAWGSAPRSPCYLKTVMAAARSLTRLTEAKKAAD